jgi:hypothetical protein
MSLTELYLTKTCFSNNVAACFSMKENYHHLVSYKSISILFLLFNQWARSESVYI